MTDSDGGLDPLAEMSPPAAGAEPLPIAPAPGDSTAPGGSEPPTIASAPGAGPDPLPDLRGVDAAHPLVIAVSACLMGHPVGYDGSAWPSSLVARLGLLPSVRLVSFCPEAHTLPVPRRAMTIHGGDGADVLDGLARVIDLDGVDLTDNFLVGAQALLDLVRRSGARLAILTDTSPSCGSSVIHDGSVLPERAYRAAPGVTTALLRRHGIPVISQRDAASLGRLLAALGGEAPDPAAFDFVHDPWYRGYFGPGGPRGPKR